MPTGLDELPGLECRQERKESHVTQESQETKSPTWSSWSDSEEESKELVAWRDLYYRKEEENRRLRSQNSSIEHQLFLASHRNHEKCAESSQAIDLAEQLAQKEIIISKLEAELIKQRHEIMGELSKRKAMQYDLIKSRQNLCDLQVDFAELQRQSLELRHGPSTDEKRRSNEV
mmetsp:Transcript_82666/g.145877  ORF Transcript_82666/g.145877 Transcript_82666/m.145877 type:complete len:174 (-) Transcript_82666:42-563(-)|eukprot:CAMPEP_0197657244 /NCGR_PEP_ID=MMETSP1338-20131121/44514_1 /TAXON_ID=43686 ORGANISM="Pelagodinium beii, Strain RCC1491" /NCGR_SAMPLE_ID=MMETSP1338 /ASSEMBLY_ACC=CAM_ASM_000754 /LENGTH=173 /DNA_ID=CAMNT_0043233573 /DNA_START=68 /DNA_END=589 /DNA_ORIENTATION=+